MAKSWKDGLSVGHPEVDAEHEALVETIDEIELAVQVTEADLEVRRLVCRLADEVDEHFLSEELLMRQSGSAGLDAHAADHQRLVARLAELERQLADGRLAPSPEMVRWLQEWFSRHVDRFDRPLRLGER
ncbi:hypothetical protein FBQ97_05860 [Acidobacteria bacterium ACD]|nr:MAG: hypothetical protein EDX89_17175 [Acidobacteriota bacterium]MCE7959490.1 hypothetical protein [Acidobacteria bacterium ACB2]MDL1949327.1 hypothetical protein [Acidobacteria bacterium ACD]